MDGSQVASIAIVGIIASTILVGIILQFLAGRRRGGALTLGEGRLAALEARLDRIENAIDTVAVEVERVSEAHRFTAKLLAERGEVLPPRRTPERVDTPR